MCVNIDEENAIDVKEKTVTLAAKFRSMGEVLGLPASELDKISQNYPHDCDEAYSRVIDTWLKQSYDTTRHGYPSWKKLAEAVASGAGGKNPALAWKIADAHRGKVVSLNNGRVEGWVRLTSMLITFAASRKRRQSNDEGVPRPKLPRNENSKDYIIPVLHLGFCLGGGGKTVIYIFYGGCPQLYI